jgi:hypothetical protein
LTQVTVNCSIATEKQNDIRLIRGGWQADAPVDACIGLKRPEISWRTSQPEDGSSAHVRG